MSLESLRADLQKLGLKPIPFVPVASKKRERLVMHAEKMKKIPRYKTGSLPTIDRQHDTIKGLLLMQQRGLLHLWVNSDVISLARIADGPKVRVTWGKAWLIVLRDRL